jgi:hypothetical protein
MTQLEKYNTILEAIKNAEALKDSAESGYAPQGWTEKQWDEIQLSDFLELVADTTVTDIRNILNTV